MKHIYRSGVLTALFTLCSFAHADAIPSCPSGTMADYLAFGATGCQSDGAIFSNFSYSDTLVTGLPAPAGDVSVAPIFGGVGLVGLSFSPRSFAWTRVNIDFEIQGLGSGIVRDDLSGSLGNFGGAPFLWQAGIMESAVPGGSLSIRSDLTCRIVEPPCREIDGISFAPTLLQNIHISGGGVDGGGVSSINADFTVPEPSTVLMLGASLAVLTARAWRRHRR